MTPRERWLAVLQHRMPDRVPMDYWATAEATAKLLKHLGCADERALCERLHIDMPVTVGPRYAGPAIPADADVFGCRYRDVDYGTGAYRECVYHPLAGYASVAEIEKHYRWPSPDWWDYSVIPGQLAGLEQYPVRGGGSEPFLAYKELRGDEQAFVDLVENPELAHYILSKLFDLAYENTRRIFETIPGKVLISYVAEDMGGQEDLMISPAKIREFLLPGMRRMMGLVHDAGAYVFHHNDGAVRRIIPDMIEAGHRRAEPDPVALSRAWSARASSATSASRVVFHGGGGQPADPAVRHARRRAARGGGQPPHPRRGRRLHPRPVPQHPGREPGGERGGALRGRLRAGREPVVSRIVIAAVGTRGDIGPAPFLARRLSVVAESGRGGREVVLVAPPENEAAARATGVEFRPLGAPFAQVVAAGSLSFYREQIRRQFVDHLDAYRGADLLVGVSLFYAGRSLAEHLDVPYRQVFFTPQVFRSRSSTPPSARRMSRSAFLNGLLWRRHVAREDFTVGTVVNAERTRLGLPRLRHVADSRTGPGTVLAVDPLFAKLPDDLAGAGIVQAHYWYHEDEGVEIDVATSRFLEAGDPPVMVCFGSMDYAVRNAAALNARLCAALAAAGHRVLLVSSKTGDALVGTDSAGIHLTGYVPHAKAMPRCRAVIHHGGVGTVFAAARAGVPQLVAPRMLDQFFWADRVRDLGIGYGPLGPADLCGPGVLQALEEVLADTDNARRVCEVRDVLAGPGRAAAVDAAIRALFSVA